MGLLLSNLFFIVLVVVLVALVAGSVGYRDRW
jgi:hypothetical protein